MAKEEFEKIQELARKEERYSKSPNYANYLQKQVNITWFHRAVAIDWVFVLAKDLHSRRETAANAVNLLDRYLGAGPVITLDRLQVIAASCLFLAEKLEDNSRVSVSSFW